MQPVRCYRHTGQGPEVQKRTQRPSRLTNKLLLGSCQRRCEPHLRSMGFFPAPLVVRFQSGRLFSPISDLNQQSPQSASEKLAPGSHPWQHTVSGKHSELRWPTPRLDAICAPESTSSLCQTQPTTAFDTLVQVYTLSLEQLSETCARVPRNRQPTLANQSPSRTCL